MIEVQHAAGMTTLTMARAPVNAIDAAFVAAFDRALDQVDAAGPKVVVVRSHERCFSAGADLALIAGYFAQPDGTRSMVAYVKELHRLFRRIERLPAVTLACINGPALGGGLELALSCDLRVAATTAKLGLPEARVGMIPGAGGTQRLTRLCGPGTASRLILGGEVVDGATAEALGIVQWSAPPEELDRRARAIAEQIAGLSRAALAASKDCILASFDRAVDGYALELEKPLVLMKNDDSRARVEQFLSRKARRAV